MKDWRIHHPIGVVDGTNRFFQSQSWTQVKPNVGVCRGDGSEDAVPKPQSALERTSM